MQRRDPKGIQRFSSSCERSSLCKFFSYRWVEESEPKPSIHWLCECSGVTLKEYSGSVRAANVPQCVGVFWYRWAEGSEPKPSIHWLCECTVELQKPPFFCTSKTWGYTKNKFRIFFVYPFFEVQQKIRRFLELNGAFTKPMYWGFRFRSLHSTVWKSLQIEERLQLELSRCIPLGSRRCINRANVSRV